MKFTQDWFTNNIPNFERCMQELGDERDCFLEIGSYEGRSACWLLQNGLSDEGELVCVEPFKDAKGFQDLDLLERFEDNTFEAKKKGQYLKLYQTYSYNAIIGIVEEYGDLLDFVYIDGHHASYSVLTDACMVWPMVRKGGVVLFDDYEWRVEPKEIDCPKIGIDAFLKCFEGQYELLFKNYQVAVVKK